eukprot:scaffold15940_cov137-Amphora_coffeaeformis.AAC.4
MMTMMMMKKKKNVVKCILSLLCHTWHTECFVDTRRQACRHRHPSSPSPFRRTARRSASSSSSSSPPFAFEYEIIARSGVIQLDQQQQQQQQDESRILPFARQAFGFPSTAQARKACRWGEIVILRPIHKNIDQDRNDDADDVIVFDTNTLDETSRAMVEENDGRVVLVADPLSAVRTGDQLARITRRSKSNGDLVGRDCYPQSLTGYVQPPRSCSSSSSSSSATDWPTVVYEDDVMAIVDKPEGLVTIGIPRQDDLQSILPFLLYVPTPSSSTTTTTTITLPRPRHPPRTNADDDDGGGGGGPFTLLEVQPQTGRTHQIRRHLSYCLGHAIVGDNKYDNGGTYVHPYRDWGLFLCANAITLSHPLTGESVSCSIPLPDKFRDILDSKHLDNGSLSSGSPQKTISYHVKQAKLELGKMFTTTEGVDCTGEPPIDPSRMINPNQGDSEWMDDFLENN